jgi:Ribonuclease G/E
VRATLCLDDAVGEHRRVLLDAFGRPFRLELERWSERGGRAKLDEVWWGRVRARMPGGQGWFVDIGLERAGTIEVSKAQAIVEGAMLPLRVKAEAWAEKGPVLSLADMAPGVPRPGRPQKHADSVDDPFLRDVEIVATLREQAARSQVEAAIEEASQREVVVSGGGSITIDTTRAMTAIDVDAGDRNAGGDRDVFALELNLAAAGEAARQISLRSIGGLVVVDFLTLQQRRHQRQVVEAFRAALAGWLGRSSKVLEMSELGLCEAAVARRMRPVRDSLAVPPNQREALDALRAIESMGWAARGSRIAARVSIAAHRWIEGNQALKQALDERIGGRWTVEEVDRPAGKPEVWSA